MLTLKEIQLICFWDKMSFYNFLKSKSIPQVVSFRRDMQVALANYSKKYPKDKITQQEILRKITRLEILAWRAYYKARQIEILKSDYSKLKKGMASVKAIARMEFEEILKNNAY